MSWETLKEVPRANGALGHIPTMHVSKSGIAINRRLMEASGLKDGDKVAFDIDRARKQLRIRRAEGKDAFGFLTLQQDRMLRVTGLKSTIKSEGYSGMGRCPATHTESGVAVVDISALKGEVAVG